MTDAVATLIRTGHATIRQHRELVCCPGMSGKERAAALAGEGSGDSVVRAEPATKGETHHG